MNEHARVMRILGFDSTVNPDTLDVHSKHAHADVWVSASLDEDLGIFEGVLPAVVRRSFELWYATVTR